jgi:excisionase family DNA binding protein
VAELLGKSLRQVRYLIQQGELPAHRDGRVWRVRDEDLPLTDARRAASPATRLGMRVSRSGLSPGPKVRRRLRVRVRAAAARGPAAMEQTVRSYRALWELGGG